MSTNPLALPEILLSVFRSLIDYHDRSDLARAIRVNKLWFDCGISILWRSPDLKHLVAVDATRRQIYASCVVKLWRVRHGDHHFQFQDLDFCSLKQVHLDGGRSAQSERSYPLEQYFPSGLRQLTLSVGSLLTNALLERLAATSTHLNSLMINTEHGSASASAIINLISRNMELDEVVLVAGKGDSFDDKLLVHLATRPNLKNIKIRGIWSANIMERVFQEVESPFGNLTTLELRVSSAAVSRLVTMLPNVNSLNLRMEDVDHDFLVHISTMTKLQTLGLEVNGFEIKPDELLSLRSLENLETLEISELCFGRFFSLTSKISDAEFELMVSNLRSLNVFYFGVQGNLSVDCLATLSRHCPQLAICSLTVNGSLQEIGLETREHPMFPKLESLSLEGVTEVGWTRQNDVR